MHILVANEPCTYREAIADVLREFRPHIGINAAVQSHVAWVVLYPDGEIRAVPITAGEQLMANNVV